MEGGDYHLSNSDEESFAERLYSTSLFTDGHSLPVKATITSMEPAIMIPPFAHGCMPVYLWMSELKEF
jgi:hypothetical protein